MASVARIFFLLAICTAINGCENPATADSPPQYGAASANESHATADEELPDPIGHVVNVHERPWGITIAPETRIAPAAAPPQSTWGETAVRGTRRAVIVSNETPSDAGGQIDSIYFTTDGATYFRINGIPLPNRPLSGIAWASGRYLVFDRWSQPHYGIHYVVDVQERRIVHATPFPDQFYLDQQRESASATPAGREPPPAENRGRR